MSRWMIVLFAVLAVPYGYLALYWGECLIGSCRLDGHMLFYSFVALIAAPFVLATIGGGVMMGGLRRVREVSVTSTPKSGAVLRTAGGGLRFWLGLVVMVTALPTCAALFYLMLYTPKEGRDSLGRICTSDGNSTTCRPDPDADRPSELDRINAARKRRQWFEKD